GIDEEEDIAGSGLRRLVRRGTETPVRRVGEQAGARPPGQKPVAVSESAAVVDDEKRSPRAVGRDPRAGQRQRGDGLTQVLLVVPGNEDHRDLANRVRRSVRGTRCAVRGFGLRQLEKSKGSREASRKGGRSAGA